MGRFKDTYDLPKRIAIYDRQSQLHPNKLAIIIEIHPQSNIQVDRYFKFMANSSYTIGSIQELLKKELSRTNAAFKNSAIFLFCKTKLTQLSKRLIEYAESKEQDNFIYFYMAQTQTF